MTTIRFTLNSAIEHDDLMKAIEAEMPNVRRINNKMPTHFKGEEFDYPSSIVIAGGIVRFDVEPSWDISEMPPFWVVGQSLSVTSESLPLSTLEAFCAIPENEDGSITIPSTLAVAIVKELTR